MISTKEHAFLAQVCQGNQAAMKILSRISTVPPDCLHCADFSTRSGFCEKWRADVPEDKQTLGCDAWTNEEIPW
jgi:hypothetical protein